MAQVIRLRPRDPYLRAIDDHLTNVDDAPDMLAWECRNPGAAAELATFIEQEASERGWPVTVRTVLATVHVWRQMNDDGEADALAGVLMAALRQLDDEPPGQLIQRVPD